MGTSTVLNRPLQSEKLITKEEAGKYKTPEETGTKPKTKLGTPSNSDKEKEEMIAKMDSDKRDSSVNTIKTPEDVCNSTLSEESKEANELRKRRLEKLYQRSS